MRRLIAVLTLLAAGVLVTSAGGREPQDPAWERDWAKRVVRMPEVWDYTTGHPSVVIAAVDTGVNTQIRDLAGAFVPGWDFTDGDATIEDANGHGTLVASVMVARGDNGDSIAGYCWQCRLMPVRVGATYETDDRTIAAGIRWAVDRGVRLINVGFVQAEGAPPDSTVGEAVRYAVSRGVLVVASAGNTGRTDPTYPGAYPGVLAVAATDRDDALYPWSTHGSWVPLAAPGCQYLISRFDTWGELCGSSFTAPVVTAIAALALSLKPSLTADEIKRALISTAVPVAGIGGGRIDAYAALRALGAISGSPPAGPPPPPPPAGLPSPSSGGSAKARPPARVKRVVRGRMRTSLRVPLDVGSGRLTVKLSLRSTSGCRLTAVSAADILLETKRRHTAIELVGRVAAGRYRIVASCRSRALKRYELTLNAAPAAADAGKSGGG